MKPDLTVKDAKCFFYLRVSGAGQIEKDGPERQLNAVQEFSRAVGMRAHHEPFFERGVSGTVEAMDRPEFSRLLDCIAADPTPQKAIVVERLDRLARDLMVQEFLLKECRTRGIQVFAADQGTLIDVASDGGDPTRKLIRQVLGALAEWEKSALVLKLRKARERKRAQTGRCEGLLPYGGTAEERTIADAIVALRERGLSFGAIVKHLNRSGVVTRWGRTWAKGTVLNVYRSAMQQKGLKA